MYGLTIAFENGFTVVYLNDKPELLKEATATIIHESVHVFQSAMLHCLESNPGAETAAYSIEFIATSLLQDFEQQMLKKETPCPT